MALLGFAYHPACSKPRSVELHCDLLKDALPTELQQRGRQGVNFKRYLLDLLLFFAFLIVVAVIKDDPFGLFSFPGSERRVEDEEPDEADDVSRPLRGRVGGFGRIGAHDVKLVPALQLRIS